MTRNFPTNSSTVLFLTHELASSNYARHLKTLQAAGCTIIASDKAAQDLVDTHGLEEVTTVSSYRPIAYKKLGLKEKAPLPEAIMIGISAPRTDEMLRKLSIAKVPVIDFIIIDATVTRERRDRLKDMVEPTMENILEAIAPNMTGAIQLAIQSDRLVSTRPEHTGLVADAIENDTFVGEESNETATAIWNLCNGNSWSLINGVSDVIKITLSKFKAPAKKLLMEMGLLKEDGVKDEVKA